MTGGWVSGGRWYLVVSSVPNIWWFGYRLQLNLSLAACPFTFPVEAETARTLHSPLSSLIFACKSFLLSLRLELLQMARKFLFSSDLHFHISICILLLLASSSPLCSQTHSHKFLEANIRLPQFSSFLQILFPTVKHCNNPEVHW